MKIEAGKKYITNGGKVVTLNYYDDHAKYGFEILDENNNHITLVNKYGVAICDDPKNNISREYVEEMDNVKQVYLDETTGKTYDSLEELKASRDDFECRVVLREAISDAIYAYVDFDVEDFIHSLKRAKNKEQVLEYLKKEIL